MIFYSFCRLLAVSLTKIFVSGSKRAPLLRYSYFFLHFAETLSQLRRSYATDNLYVAGMHETDADCSQTTDVWYTVLIGTKKG